MSSTPQRDVQRQGRLARSAASLLSLAIVLKRSHDLDGFPDLRRSVDRMFHEFRSQARDEGVADDDIRDASYAMAAFIDETLLTATWNGRGEWQADALAKHYCNDEFVGDGFFDKLAEVRRAVPPRLEVVEVFYYCLISGFRGRLIESEREHADLVNELSHEIGTRMSVLAPDGLPVPEGGRLQPIKRFPWPAVVLVSVLVPIVLWLLSWNLLDRHAAHIVRALGGD